jgi:hypothetical protein
MLSTGYSMMGIDTTPSLRSRVVPLRGTVSGSTPSLTVGELIARLQQADPNALVVIAGQYGGFDGVLAVGERPLKLNVNGLDGFGRHDLPAEGEPPDVTGLAILVAP